MRRTVTVVLAVMALALTGCGGSPWPDRVPVQFAASGEAPPFPAHRAHWRLQREWPETIRVFDQEEWSTATGPDPSKVDFPRQGNHCDQEFLIRWRVLGTLRVVAAQTSRDVSDFPVPDRPPMASAALPVEHAVTGASGWEIVGGCELPVFRVAAGSPAGELTDVTVEVRQYVPAV